MKEIPDETRKQLNALEETMWQAQTRFDRDYMLQTLTPDFFEFGRSGRTYNLDECLAAPACEIDAALRDFSVRPVSEMLCYSLTSVKSFTRS